MSPTIREVGQRGWNVFSQYVPAMPSNGRLSPCSFALGDEARTATCACAIAFHSGQRSERLGAQAIAPVLPIGYLAVASHLPRTGADPLFSLTDEQLRNPLGVAVLGHPCSYATAGFFGHVKGTLTQFELHG